VVKVQTDISRLVDQETMLVARLEVISRKIAGLIGRPQEALTLRPIDLELTDVSPDRAALEDEAVRAHPTVRGSETGIEAGQAWVKQRELGTRPDFHLGVSWIGVGDREDAAAALNPPEDNGQDVWALTVGVSIPVYRAKTRAAVAEAQEVVNSGHHALSRTRHRLRQFVQEKTLELDSADRRARLYRDVIVPQARQSLHSAEAAYSTGSQDFLDLLDAQRVLLQARLTYHRLIADQHVALADLEYGIGRAFPGAGVDHE
jgi:outer membrane protein TolC